MKFDLFFLMDVFKILVFLNKQGRGCLLTTVNFSDFLNHLFCFGGFRLILYIKGRLLFWILFYSNTSKNIVLFKLFILCLQVLESTMGQATTMITPPWQCHPLPPQPTLPQLLFKPF